jgi:hypothetical protein
MTRPNGRGSVSITRETWDRLVKASADTQLSIPRIIEMACAKEILAAGAPPEVTGCQHLNTRRGKNSPRKYGSFLTVVCTDCGAFHLTTFNGDRVLRVGRKPTDWDPASEYAKSTAPLEAE